MLERSRRPAVMDDSHAAFESNVDVASSVSPHCSPAFKAGLLDEQKKSFSINAWEDGRIKIFPNDFNRAIVAAHTASRLSDLVACAAFLPC